MRRQPIHDSGWLWRALLAVLVLTGLGIWHGGHCASQAAVDQPAAAANAAATYSDAPAVLTAAVTSAARDGDRQGAAVKVPPVELPHTAADDCHVVSPTEPATTTSVTNASPPVRYHAGVVGDAALRPVPRLLTSRPLTEIGVSRT